MCWYMFTVDLSTYPVYGDGSTHVYVHIRPEHCLWGRVQMTTGDLCMARMCNHPVGWGHVVGARRGPVVAVI